jgi:hypothetical protein
MFGEVLLVLMLEAPNKSLESLTLPFKTMEMCEAYKEEMITKHTESFLEGGQYNKRSMRSWGVCIEGKSPVKDFTEKTGNSIRSILNKN